MALLDDFARADSEQNLGTYCVVSPARDAVVTVTAHTTSSRALLDAVHGLVLGRL